MDGRLVTDQSFTENGDIHKGDAMESRSSSFFRYTDIFDKVCPYYMHIGMTWDDFWHGEPDMCKFYREKNKLDIKQRNSELWLQGFYVYTAILNSSPAFNFFGKKRDINPYMEEPLDLFGEKEKEIKKKEEDNQQKMENGKAFMMAWMSSVNKQKEREAQQNGRNIKPPI